MSDCGKADRTSEPATAGRTDEPATAKRTDEPATAGRSRLATEERTSGSVGSARSGRLRRGFGDRDRGPVRRADPDRGSATLWLLTAGLALVVFSLGGAAIGAARVARHQARVAADLGALAGAAHSLGGLDAACARAAAIAAANSGRITGCTIDGLDLQITVEVAVAPLPGLRRSAAATARAGPARG